MIRTPRSGKFARFFWKRTSDCPEGGYLSGAFSLGLERFELLDYL
jgi:hypothetical protein